MGLIQTANQNISIPKSAKLYRQTYDRPEQIAGLHIFKTNTFADDFGGWFKETMRFDTYGHCVALKELGVEFKPVQTNSSHLGPKTKRFWHVHPIQNEVWTTNGTILLGLIDFRPGSATYGLKMKIVLSNDKAVYIPHGVAHGFMNPNLDFVTLNYFTDQYFAADDKTQEYRISPKKISYNFVKPEIM